MWVPGEPKQERVEVSELPLARLGGEREHVSVSGDEVAARVTVGEKPSVRVMVIVEIPGDPWFTLTVVGFASRLKSGRLKTRQMLLSTIPMANSRLLLPKGPVLDNEKAISMNTPDPLSNANPEEDENEKSPKL